MAAEQERSLLEGLARNDRRSIEAIYKANYNLIQALVVRNSGTAEDAKDVFQEAMIVLFEKVRASKEGLSCQVQTFLYSVARRIWLKRLMQQNRFMITETDSETVQVEDELEDHEKKNTEFLMMERAMGNIGEPCKSLLESFYLKKESMQQIAANFGYTNSENAKNQKYKCLMRLKKLFFSQYKSNNSE